ncbi:MAG: type II secretion system protein N [Steroidobacteraceae bacterium]
MASTRFSWRLAIVIVVAVLVTMAVRWPLAWTTKALPEGVQCAEPAGSVWRGRCGALTAGGLPFGATSWQVRALPLLRGTLAAQVRAQLGADRISGEFEWRPDGRRMARRVEADLTLGAGLLAQGAMGLSGRLHARIDRAVLRGRRVHELIGLVTVQQLAQGGTPLGNFEIRFPDAPVADDPKGELRDLGGPLGVTGTLTLTDEPGYVIDGQVTVRAETPPALAAQIAILGTPDAGGRRPFSLAGTY